MALESASPPRVLSPHVHEARLRRRRNQQSPSPPTPAGQLSKTLRSMRPRVTSRHCTPRTAVWPQRLGHRAHLSPVGNPPRLGPQPAADDLADDIVGRHGGDSLVRPVPPTASSPRGFGSTVPQFSSHFDWWEKKVVRRAASRCVPPTAAGGHEGVVGLAALIEPLLFGHGDECRGAQAGSDPPYARLQAPLPPPSRTASKSGPNPSTAPAAWQIGEARTARPGMSGSCWRRRAGPPASPAARTSRPFAAGAHNASTRSSTRQRRLAVTSRRSRPPGQAAGQARALSKTPSRRA